MDNEELRDRIEIADLLTTYARAVDQQDWSLYRQVFTASAHIDYTSAGGVAGDVDTVAAWLEETLAGFAMTQHLISNLRPVPIIKFFKKIDIHHGNAIGAAQFQQSLV